MPRLSETAYAAVYQDNDGEYVLFRTVAAEPGTVEDIRADFEKHNKDEKHGTFQRIGKFRIEERVWDESVFDKDFEKFKARYMTE